MALQQIGWLVMTGGKYEEAHGERARELAGRALELARSIGDKLVQSGSLNILAELSAEEGDEATANELYEQSLTLRRELGDKRLIANSLLTLGRAELTRGDYEKATAHLQEGFALVARDRRHVEHVARAHEPRPRRAAPAASDNAEAAKLFADALKLAKERGDKRVAAECLQGLGAVVGERRRRGAGGAALRRVRRAARGDRRDADDDRGRAERAVHPLGKSSLGDERFTTEWVAGRAEPPEEAIEEALSVAGSGPGRVAA